MGKLKSLKISQIPIAFLHTLMRRSGWFFLSVFLILSGFCGYIWYANIYHSEWSSAKKEQYIQIKNKGNMLNKENYNHFVQEARGREAEFQKTIDAGVDMFRLKK